MVHTIWWLLPKWERRRIKIMAYTINEECIACGTCEATCPIDTIKEGAPAYSIDEDCVECGACAAACPVGAILAP